MSFSVNANAVGKSTPTASPRPSTEMVDKNKQWQMELLMEKLRNKAKAQQYKSFQEVSKSARMTLLEKRYALDAVEKANLQKTLDSMQHCIKVTSRQGLIERLDCLTRQLGLKLNEVSSNIFISSDMFYLEIILNANGTVQDVKVHHECKPEPQSCNELVSCLQRGDFTDFTAQLEGLASIYQLNAEKNIKLKAFLALQALETDLYSLSVIRPAQAYKDTKALLFTSPLGVVQKRRGGHPMKLTYFVAPYELLDLDNKTAKPLNVELIMTEKIGHSVSVNLEASTANKLQIQPILTFNNNVPSYNPLGQQNSTLLPATFVLRLNKPMPICYNSLTQIKKITSEGQLLANSVEQQQNVVPLLGLIVQNASNGAIANSQKGLFITLPDQQHVYYMTDSGGLKGVLISSVPFTEPQQVPKILHYLRQQAMFNTLIGSCIRPNSNVSRFDYEMMGFEITAMSNQYISITLEHPFDESLATVEFDLSDLMHITCKIYCGLQESSLVLCAKIATILQVTLSIPVTLRALVKIWEQEHKVQYKLANSTNGENGNFSPDFHMNDSNGVNPSNGSDNMNNGTSGGAGRQNQNNQDFCDNMKTMKTMMNTASAVSGNQGNFWKSPKSSNVKDEFYDEDEEMEEDDDDYDESTNMSADSNSLGGSNSNTMPTLSLSENVAAGVSGLGENSGNSSLLGNIDFSNLDPDLMRSSSSDMDENNDLLDSDLFDKSLNKSKLGSDVEARSKEMPSVSITPIGSGNSGSQGGGSFSTTAHSNLGHDSRAAMLEKRPLIEIIPLAMQAGPNVPSSITITPINNTTSSSEKSDKKSSNSNSKRSSSGDRSKQEKKKKRKREDSPMGPPPEKHSVKQDPLNKPVSVSIKSSDGSPVSPSGLLRKFATSPVQNKSGGSSILSGNSSGSKSSPKHSPAHHSSPKHGTSSPKHLSGSSGGGKPSMSALKSAANSPSSKTSSSGEKSKSSSGSSSKDRDKDRDKDKKSFSSSSSGSSSPKLKTPTIKLKQLDLSNLAASVPIELLNAAAGGIDLSEGGSDSMSMLFQQGSKNKAKNSLSAVIDKLKSAQHNSTEDLLLLQEAARQEHGVQRSASASSLLGGSSGGKSSEYMVKPSSDGIKLTINKKASKSSSSSSSSKPSGGLSKTGLKPGVTSGPASASKKSQSSSSSSSNQFNSGVPTNKSSSTKSFQKSSSSGSLGSSKSSSKITSPKSGSNPPTSSSSMGMNLSSKDKSRYSAANVAMPLKTPTASDVMKMLGFASNAQAMEGFMKTFDSKFQIPKLSARSMGGGGNNGGDAVDSCKKEAKQGPSSAPTTPVPNIVQSPNGAGSNSNDSHSAKLFSDFYTNKELSQKYNFPFNKLPGDVSPMHMLPNTMQKMGVSFQSDNSHLHKTSSSDAFLYNRDNSNPGGGSSVSGKSNPTTPTHQTVAPPFPSPGLMNHTSEYSQDNTADGGLMRPPSRPSSTVSNHSHSSDNPLIDFSSTSLSSQILNKLDSNQVKITPTNPSPTSSSQSSTTSNSTSQKTAGNNSSSIPPLMSSHNSLKSPASVSVHIVKSPSPLMVIPSPHSNNSSHITDDEFLPL